MKYRQVTIYASVSYLRTTEKTSFSADSRSMSIKDALKNLKSEIYISIFHRYGCMKAKRLKGKTDLKLHLGCGTKIKKGWINVDWDRRFADIVLDFRRPLPFEDNVCSFIYSEHMLEHLDYPEPVHSFLKELFRVMAFGATVRIGVPNAEWAVNAYMYPDKEKEFYKLATEVWHPKWCQTPMEHLNHHFHMNGQHRFVYDEETLIKALNNARFNDVHRSQYDPSIDSEDRQPGTLYVVATKPMAW